jgi:hypothetical protein
MLIKHMKHSFGQSLVEFALILPTLMIIIMGLFEFGRMFQVWLTLQYSAEAAARYASTGQNWVDPTIDPYDSARLAAVKAEALNNAVTLGIQPSAGVFDPGYFQVYVYSSLPGGIPTPPGGEYPGAPNARVIVDVVFNHPLITPLFTMFGRYITLKAHSEMINERFRFPGYGTPAGTLPPTIPPTPTPTNTPTPTETPVPTDTPTDTPTPTP